MPPRAGVTAPVVSCRQIIGYGKRWAQAQQNAASLLKSGAAQEAQQHAARAQHQLKLANSWVPQRPILMKLLVRDCHCVFVCLVRSHTDALPCVRRPAAPARTAVFRAGRRLHSGDEIAEATGRGRCPHGCHRVRGPRGRDPTREATSQAAGWPQRSSVTVYRS